MCDLTAASLLADLLDEEFSAEGLGSFDGEAEGSRPDQLREASESARYAEHHRVIVHLFQTVILWTIYSGHLFV